jgi:hypothetical protein
MGIGVCAAVNVFNGISDGSSPNFLLHNNFHVTVTPDGWDSNGLPRQLFGDMPGLTVKKEPESVCLLQARV